MIALPKVGSKVTVVVRYNGHPPVFVPLFGGFSPKSPETATYEGVVKRPDSWMKTDEFNMTTDMKSFPVRTISLTNVISIDGIKVGDLPKDDTRIVDVKGSKGDIYKVTVRNGVGQSCTCTGFGFRKRCSHLSQVSK